jgi:large-conductance mechanosensitive channel
MTINNLRMATKYSFHVRPLRLGETEKSARSESFTKDDKSGQKIIIPTKGFSAVATKCLPNESEILVETGPFFSGKIASENGECRIQGNAKDSKESYVMRIDHEKCGSQVSHNDLTVETYITVQENSGILTHSTRRFLVVCTFQPDTLTVRARLALPGKGDVVPEGESWSERERESRNRQFKMVDKSALILKESSENSMENAIGDIENLTEKILSQMLRENSFDKSKKFNSFKNARYSRYFADQKREVFQTEAFVGGIVGMALIVLIVFIALYTIRRNRNREHMEKLQTNSYYN